MSSLVSRTLLAAALLLPMAFAHAADASIDAPNVVAISPMLVTSGQPSERALGLLASQGFQADIYLAPPTVHGAIRNEGDIVRGQGLEFVNIPIEFGEPTDADFQRFVATMNALQGKKVLVHCQVNMRASSMTFLYRVIALHEPPEHAYEAVARVWSPDGPWKRLITDELRKAGIAFEAY